MECFKKLIILASPNSNLYADLLLENTLNDLKKGNSINIILNDTEYRNILYRMIIYGRLKSKSFRHIDLHSRLETLDEIDKHNVSLEIERFSRYHYIIDTILFVNLIIVALFLYIK